jgi:hypothetical protein
MDLEKVLIKQVFRSKREGSVLEGTAKSTILPLEVRIEIKSGEPPERIEHLLRIAKSTCNTHAALAQQVEVQPTVTLNGSPLEVSLG